MTRARNGAAPRRYTVDDCSPTGAGLRWALATSSEDDPAILVEEDHVSGTRSYTYGDGSPCGAAHRRRAAAVIGAYNRSRR